MDNVEFYNDDEAQWSSATQIQTNNKHSRKRKFDLSSLHIHNTSNECAIKASCEEQLDSNKTDDESYSKRKIRKPNRKSTSTSTDHHLRFSDVKLDSKSLNSNQLHVLLEPFFRLNLPVSHLDPTGEGRFLYSDIFIAVYIIALNRGLIFSRLKVKDFFINPNVIINNMYKDPSSWPNDKSGNKYVNSKKDKSTSQQHDLWTEALRTASGVFNCSSKSEIFKITHMIIPVCNFRRNHHDDKYLFYLVYRYFDSSTQSVRYYSFNMLDNESSQDLFNLSQPKDNKTRNITSMDQILKLCAAANDDLPRDFDIKSNFKHVQVKYNEGNDQPMIFRKRSDTVLYCNRTKLYDRLIGLIHFLFIHKSSIDAKLFDGTLVIDCSSADLTIWSRSLLEFEPELNDIHTLRNRAQLTNANPASGKPASAEQSQSVRQLSPQLQQAVQQALQQTVPQAVQQAVPQSTSQVQQSVPRSVPQSVPQSDPQSVPQSVPQVQQSKKVQKAIPRSAPQIPRSVPQSVRRSVSQVQKSVPQVQQSVSKVQQPVPNSVSQVQKAIPRSAPQIQQSVPQVQQSVPKVQQSVPQSVPQSVRRSVPQVQQSVPKVQQSVPNSVSQVQKTIPQSAPQIQQLSVQHSTNLQSSDDFCSNGIIFDFDSERKCLQSTKIQHEKQSTNLQTKIMESKAKTSELSANLESYQAAGTSKIEQSINELRSIYSGYTSSLEIRRGITTQMENFISARKWSEMSELVENVECFEQRIREEEIRCESLLISNDHLSNQIKKCDECINQIGVYEDEITALQIQIRNIDQDMKKVSDLFNSEIDNVIRSVMNMDD